MFSKNMILKLHVVKSVTGASIWVKFISKNSNTLEMKQSLLNGIFRPDAQRQFGDAKHVALVLEHMFINRGIFTRHAAL